MNAGTDIKKIAGELERQLETRRDFIAPAGRLRLRFADEEKAVVMEGLNNGPMQMRKLAHEQVGSFLGIPRQYYERMRTAAPGPVPGGKRVSRWQLRQGVKEIDERT